jgi:hypothetical protein
MDAGSSAVDSGELAGIWTQWGTEALKDDWALVRLQDPETSALPIGTVAGMSLWRGALNLLLDV